MQLLELIKWARHGENSFSFLAQILWCYRLLDGQSHLARNIFEEARRTERLCWSLETRVSSIIDRNGSVEVVTDKGSFKALKVVSTLPQNVAAKVRFDPPLSPLKQEAFSIKHVGQGHKIHSFFNKPELRSGVWNAWHENPEKTYELAAAFGDHTMRDGRVSVVAFGGGNSKKLLPSHEPSKIPTWLADIDPIFAETYSGSIWHEWWVLRLCRSFVAGPPALIRFVRSQDQRRVCRRSLEHAPAKLLHALPHGAPKAARQRRVCVRREFLAWSFFARIRLTPNDAL